MSYTTRWRVAAVVPPCRSPGCSGSPRQGAECVLPDAEVATRVPYEVDA
jgi:hypothetical protein